MMRAELAALMVPMLTADEGFRLFVYDDKTGEKIGPGSVVRGHPTIGIGRALDTNGISQAEAAMLLTNDLARVATDLDREIPWWRSLSLARQAVLASMAFQLGTRGLLGFRNTLAAVRTGAYDAAAAGMLASTWAKQTPDRVQRLAAIMRGTAEPTVPV